ncbi:hypothetical protein AWB81_08409 [Caballeronia arationis]|nr:hypothetical protein AWB81_08409 [Caballeronia arationis]
MGDALEEAMGDDRLERVELKLARLRCEADRHIVADDFERDLVDDFRNDRIHLSRHDAGAGLHRRQVDFSEAGARAARKESKVVAGLRELDRDTLQHTGKLHERADVLRRFDQVRRRRERNAGYIAQMPARELRILGMRIDTGPDRRRAQVDLADQLRGFLEPLFVFAEHDRERAEFLPERHWHRVLKLCAAHFEVVSELLRLALERCAQHAHRLDQLHDARIGGDLQGGRVDIVRALPEIHVLVRMQNAVFAPLMAEMFEREVRDDLVRVHVGRSPRAALDDIDDEVIMRRARADLPACLDNRLHLEFAQ